MSIKAKTTVNEILNVVGTDMLQIARHNSDFPFEQEAEDIIQKLVKEFPNVLVSTNSRQEFVSEELRGNYIELLKKVQQWEKETGQKSVIQFVKAE